MRLGEERLEEIRQWAMDGGQGRAGVMMEEIVSLIDEVRARRPMSNSCAWCGDGWWECGCEAVVAQEAVNRLGQKVTAPRCRTHADACSDGWTVSSTTDIEVPR